MLNMLCVLQEKYHLKLPPYPGTSQCVKLGRGSGGKSDPSQIRLNYDLADKGGGLLEEHVDADPMKQFDKWFQVCPTLPLIRLSQDEVEPASSSCAAGKHKRHVPAAARSPRSRRLGRQRLNMSAQKRAAVSCSQWDLKSDCRLLKSPASAACRAHA